MTVEKLPLVDMLGEAEFGMNFGLVFCGWMAFGTTLSKTKLSGKHDKASCFHLKPVMHDLANALPSISQWKYLFGEG